MQAPKRRKGIDFGLFTPGPGRGNLVDACMYGPCECTRMCGVQMVRLQAFLPSYRNAVKLG